MGNSPPICMGFPKPTTRFNMALRSPGYLSRRLMRVFFGDGHSEIHKWRDARTTPPLKRDSQVGDSFGSPLNQDVACSRTIHSPQND